MPGGIGLYPDPAQADPAKILSSISAISSISLGKGCKCLKKFRKDGYLLEQISNL